MADDLFDRFRDVLQEVPEAENALRAWRNRLSLQAARRRMRARYTEILVKCYGGYEPDNDNGGGTR